jgi:hypothetical protein
MQIARPSQVETQGSHPLPANPMKTTITKLLFAFSSGLLISSSAQAALIHRYSFANDANDSVGTANGTLAGGASVAGGQVMLDGSSGYVDLPNNLVSNLTNITFEAWVTDNGSAGWARIYDFGNSVGGEDQQGGGTQYMFLALPSGTATLRGAYTITGGGAGEQIVEMSGRPPVGVEAHVVWTSDAASHTARLYVNGARVAENPNVTLTPASIGPTVNDWLGRSQFNDPYFNGSINEFRIYDTALNAVEVAGSFASGADTPSTDPGAIQALRLQVVTNMIVGNSQASAVQADFAKATGVNLAGVPGVTFQSSDTNVITVSPAGQLLAVGVGSASVTVGFQGKSDAKSIGVKQREGLVTAGTLYVDLRATDSSAGTGTWINRTTFGNFAAVGAPVLETNVAGTGVSGVQFNGTTDAYTGPNTVPDLDGGSDRSIEVWAFNPDIAQEETLVALGYRGTTRRNLSVNYGSNPSYGAVGHWADDLGWTTDTPAAGQWHYIVYTYDGASTARIYADAVLKTQRTLGGPLDTFTNQPIKLAAQGATDGASLDFGQALSGYIAVVRVHGGLLSPADILNNYLLGINLTSAGALKSVKLQSDTNLILNGFGQVSVMAAFASGTNADVTPFADYQSSATNVVTVSTNGLLHAIGVGSATITASYQGQQDTKTVQVAPPPKPALQHRWSFNDAPGSLSVTDSVGQASGTLFGGVTLTGGTAVLDGSSGYIEFPTNLLTSYQSVTLETWVTDTGSAGWARIFDFGNSVGGPGQQGGGLQNMFLSLPAGGGNLRGAYSLNDGGASEQVLEWVGNRPPAQTKAHIVWTTDGPTRTGRLYVNGQQVGINTNMTLTPVQVGPTSNDWLGRSQYNDPYFAGDFDEFRIYDGALAATDIQADFAAGPDLLPRTGPGAVQSLNLQLGTNNLFLGGFTTIKLNATFADATTADVTSSTNTTFVSSDTGVFTVGTNALLDTVGVGQGQLIASYQGKSASNTITVVAISGVPAQPVLIHRYGFNDAPGSTTVKDSVGTADGTLNGTGSFTNGQLNLPGTDGYVSLPGPIVSTLTNITLEAWVTWNGNRAWERIFDFGSNTGGPGQQGTGDTYLFLTPQANSATLRFAITTNSGGAESPILNGPTALPDGKESHVAVSYNLVAGVARLYLNGQRVAQGIAGDPLSIIAEDNDWLGRSQYADPNFNGLFNEFRIYNGAMLDVDVAADFAAGPDALPGTVSTVKLGVAHSGASVMVSWPASAAGFILQSSPSLGPTANWQPVTATPTVANGQNTVTVTPNNATAFYRLRK